MKVIYISGAGRNGSTLLERLLHATADCAAVGEFHCLWRQKLEQTICSCGMDASFDPFWRDILDRAELRPDELAELERLENIVARTPFILRHGYRLDRLRANRDVQRFLALNFRIFEAIAAKTGQPVVVDSSKAGPRAWILACDPRVAFIHLYRDPTDVIASWKTRKFDHGLGEEMQRRSKFRAAVEWLKVEYLARRLARQNPVHMIAYLTLCENTRQTIDQTLRVIGMEGSHDTAWLNADLVAPTLDYHSLNGNPHRFDRDAIAISARHADWEQFGPVEATVIRALGGLLATIYTAPEHTCPSPVPKDAQAVVAAQPT